MAVRIRKAVHARCCLHAADPKQERQSAGLHAGPVATDSPKAALRSMGILRLSEPGHMFIQEFWETGFGPQRAAQRTHSLNIPPSSIPGLQSQTVTEDLKDLPIYAECPVPHIQSQSQEERRAGTESLPGLLIPPLLERDQGAVQGDFWC